MNEDVKESERAGLGMEYGKFVKFVFDCNGKSVSSKRPIKGVFKNKGEKAEHKGDSFIAWNVGGDALLSYQAACAYFNRDLRPGEKERIAVSAEWDLES